MFLNNELKKTRGRKWPWANMRYDTEYALTDRGKPRKLLTAYLRAEIWTLDLPNTKQRSTWPRYDDRLLQVHSCRIHNHSTRRGTLFVTSQYTTVSLQVVWYTFGPWTWRYNFPPRPHELQSQKIVLFTVAAERTSNASWFSTTEFSLYIDEYFVESVKQIVGT